MTTLYRIAVCTIIGCLLGISILQNNQIKMQTQINYLLAEHIDICDKKIKNLEENVLFLYHRLINTEKVLSTSVKLQSSSLFPQDKAAIMAKTIQDIIKEIENDEQRRNYKTAQ